MCSVELPKFIYFSLARSLAYSLFGYFGKMCVVVIRSCVLCVFGLVSPPRALHFLIHRERKEMRMRLYCIDFRCAMIEYICKEWKNERIDINVGKHALLRYQPLHNTRRAFIKNSPAPCICVRVCVCVCAVCVNQMSARNGTNKNLFREYT